MKPCSLFLNEWIRQLKQKVTHSCKYMWSNAVSLDLKSSLLLEVSLWSFLCIDEPAHFIEVSIDENQNEISSGEMLKNIAQGDVEGTFERWGRLRHSDLWYGEFILPLAPLVNIQRKSLFFHSLLLSAVRCAYFC